MTNESISVGLLYIFSHSYKGYEAEAVSAQMQYRTSVATLENMHHNRLKRNRAAQLSSPGDSTTH